jgi:transcriptional regulator with XRE-family HTH domain
MSDKFRAWLSEELNQRGWSHNELARKAKVSQAAVSSILSGNRNAGAEFCIKIARALEQTPEKLLRLAEILPPLPSEENDPTLRKLFDTLRNMSSEQRKEVLRYARYLYQSGQEGD